MEWPSLLRGRGTRKGLRGMHLLVESEVFIPAKVFGVLFICVFISHSSLALIGK